MQWNHIPLCCDRLFLIVKKKHWGGVHLEIIVSMIASVSLSHARTKAGMSSIDVPPSLSLSVCRSVCPRHAGALVKPSWSAAFYFVCKEIGTCVTRSMITRVGAFDDCLPMLLSHLIILLTNLALYFPVSSYSTCLTSPYLISSHLISFQLFLLHFS